jgi:hypothetical protein
MRLTERDFVFTNPVGFAAPAGRDVPKRHMAKREQKNRFKDTEGILFEGEEAGSS